MNIQCVATNPRTQARKEEEKGIARTCANYPRKTWDAINDCTLFALLLRPRVQGCTDMTLPCTLAHGRRVKKHTVVCSNPGFLGVVGTYVCNHTCRYYRLRKQDWKLLT